MRMLTSQARSKSKGSKAKGKTKFAIKNCWFCHAEYKGSNQSHFCSDYCVQRASRRRKAALVELLAGIMVEHSGVPLAYDRALLVSENTIRAQRDLTKYNLMALGYAYDEIGKQWRLQPRLR